MIKKTVSIVFGLALIFLLPYLYKTKKKVSFDQQSIIICLAGDVMIGRTINEIMQTKGLNFPWGNISTVFKEADCTLINLETTLTTHQIKEPKVFNFQSLPYHVQSLKNAHINAVNIANNHIKDFGNTGLLETIKTLQAAHIAYTGAGKNIAEAIKPAIIKTKSGLKIGILGYTDNEETWAAKAKQPGINYIKIDPNNMQPIINNIKKIKPSVDILIISLHWGPNMITHPLPEHIPFAHTLIDHGADIIHGHSAHVLQGIELYKNKLILYDTGDLIDDYAIDPIIRNDLSAIFKITLVKNSIQSIQAIPVKIEKMQTNLLEDKAKEDVYSILNQRSSLFNTYIDKNGFVKLQNHKT